MNFTFTNPVNLVFGCGKINAAGEECKKFGSKALIITGASSTKKSGLLAKVQDLLAKEGISSVVADNIPQNPTTDAVMQAAQTARDNNCDMVIGLGGGSSLDAAKAIAFMAKHEGHVSEYILGQRTPNGSCLPVIAIPTTCGTGSEADCFAVLNNDETNDKRTLRQFITLPKLSIVDPELMMTMPAGVLRSVMFDALVHNIEGYLSRHANPISEMFSLKGVELLAENMPKLLADSNDKAAWEAVCLASTFGGFSLQNAGNGAVHGVEHPASGLRNVIHGKGLSAVIIPVLETTVSACPERFAVLSKIMGGTSEHDFLDQVNKIRRYLDLEVSLKDLGVQEEDLPWLAHNATQVSKALLSNHPRSYTEEELLEIYKKAF